MVWAPFLCKSLSDTLLRALSVASTFMVGFYLSAQQQVVDFLHMSSLRCSFFHWQVKAESCSQSTGDVWIWVHTSLRILQQLFIEYNWVTGPFLNQSLGIILCTVRPVPEVNWQFSKEQWNECGTGKHQVHSSPHLIVAPGMTAGVSSGLWILKYGRPWSCPCHWPRIELSFRKIKQVDLFAFFCIHSFWLHWVVVEAWGIFSLCCGLWYL